MTDREQEYIKSDIKVVKDIYEYNTDKMRLYFDTDSLKLDQNIQYDFIIQGRGERSNVINTRERGEDLCKFSESNDNA